MAAEFITYIAIFSQVTRPAKDISKRIQRARSGGLASGERVIELIDTESTIRDKPGAVALNGLYQPDISTKTYPSPTIPIRRCYVILVLT